MQPSIFVASFIMLTCSVFGQSTNYCDPLTSICYQSYTNWLGISYRLALPNTTSAPFDVILQIVAPVEHKWTGFSFGGRMQFSPLAVTWANGADVVGSPRWTTAYSAPKPYSGAKFTPLRGTGVNSTAWTLTVLCQGCSTWKAKDGTVQTLNLTSTAPLAWSQSFKPVFEASNSESSFTMHNNRGTWTHNLAAARNSLFDTWVSSNLINESTVTSSFAQTTSTTTSVIELTTASVTLDAQVVLQRRGLDIPTSCPGVPQPKYPGSVAEGWRAVKIAGGLKTPRGIIVDTLGRLLVAENGKGITQHTLGSDGCIVSSKTIIAQTTLNHGVAVSPDGKYLYASSLTTVWRWNYDSNAGTATGSTVVVSGMNNGGHPTRTLVIPKNKGNLLVVSLGSSGNLDMPTVDMATQRAVVKVFDMNSFPSGGYNFVTGGWQAGYGLRNEVGLVFDADNKLWGVENSADDLTRVVNGQTTDIHVDNPAEELNYLGDVSVPNTKWYGYPVCFTVWDPSVIRDMAFQPGDQFMIQPNSSFNDATCAQRSTPPRLSFQAHSAPLDANFDNDNQNLYVSFHGSWNRPTPTGFKVVVVPFQRGSNGQLEPVAAANSRSGYKDIWWNTDSSKCSSTTCFRPVGVTHDSIGRMFVTSDAPGEGEIFLLGTPNAVTSSSSTSTTSGATQITTSTSRIVTTSATTTTSSAGAQQTKWGQCGGQGWTGPTACVAGSTCQFSNNWYSQCL